MVSGPSTAGFTISKAGSVTLTATGPPAPTLTEQGDLPAGVTFTAQGGTATIAGTPQGGSRRKVLRDGNREEPRR